MLYADIAPMKLAGYAGQAAAPVAADRGTSLSQQGLEDIALLTDLHRRFYVLLTGVLERGWNNLEDWYTYECTSLPSYWRGIVRRVAMAGQEACHLCAGGAEPLVQDTLDID